MNSIVVETTDKYRLIYNSCFPDAAKFVAFIVNAIEEHRPIIFQCKYCHNRSAAHAAATKMYYDRSEIQILTDYRYYRNQFVFKKNCYRNLGCIKTLSLLEENK